MEPNDNVTPDGNLVHVDLIHPVQVGTRDTVLTVTLRRPTLTDMMRANKEANGNDLLENLTLVRLLGDLTRAELDAMDWGDDITNLLTGLQCVVGKSPPTGDRESVS